VAFIGVVLGANGRPGGAPGIVIIVVMDKNVFAGLVFIKVRPQKPGQALGPAVLIKAITCPGCRDDAAVDLIRQKIGPGPGGCRVGNDIFMSIWAKMAVRHTDGNSSKF